MWLKRGDGKIEIVNNVDHIRRLLDDGWLEIADPTIPKKPKEKTLTQVSATLNLTETPAVESKVKRASTTNHVEHDSQGENADSRPGRNGTAVPKPRLPRSPRSHEGRRKVRGAKDST